MVRSRENPCLLSTRSVTKWMVQFRLDPMLHACKPSHIHLQHPPTIIQHAACRRPSTTLRTPRKQWKDGRTVGDSNVGWSFYTHTYKPLWQKISLLEWLHMSLYFNHKMHGPYFILVNCFHPCHSRPFQAWSERLKRKRRNEKRHWPKRQRNRNRRKWMMPKMNMIRSRGRRNMTLKRVTRKSGDSYILTIRSFWHVQSVRVISNDSTCLGLQHMGFAHRSVCIGVLCEHGKISTCQEQKRHRTALPVGHW